MNAPRLLPNVDLHLVRSLEYKKNLVRKKRQFVDTPIDFLACAVSGNLGLEMFDVQGTHTHRLHCNYGEIGTFYIIRCRNAGSYK